MPRRHVVPPELAGVPFTPAEAAAVGVSRRQLCGTTYRRVFPRVWVQASHELTLAEWVLAAGKSLPLDAVVTGLTRVQLLGLDVGPERPLHFVIDRDLHLDIPGVVLHRTDRLAPTDAVGIAPAGAFIAFCASASVIDAVVVGDWLLRGGHVAADELRSLALGAPWRHGAMQALWILRHLDAGSRSPGESRVRTTLSFAGLPEPEVNVEIVVDGRVVAIGDLGYRRWRTVVEYEGGHHQTTRRQYLRDIERYQDLRNLDLSLRAGHQGAGGAPARHGGCGVPRPHRQWVRRTSPSARPDLATARSTRTYRPARGPRRAFERWTCY